MNRKEYLSPQIDHQIDWNKTVTQIIAEHCEITPNSAYFLASAIYLRLIPSYGYIKISYNFNKLETVPEFSHILVIEHADFRVINSSLKYRIDNARIDSVELMGNKIGFATDIPGSFDIVENQNEMIITTNLFSLLIIPEFSTAQIRFTFATKAINRYIENEWKENVSDDAIQLERMKILLPDR